MKKNQRGVTLIALVVTIIVLLILAATAIATLTGEDGIITNAQKAQAANTEGEVIDRMNLAYNAVYSQSMIKMSTENGYQPSAKYADLAKAVADELGITKTTDQKVDNGNYTKEIGGGTWTITSTAATADPGATPATIKIEYRDAKFALDFSGDKTYPENNQYPKLSCTITLDTNKVSFTAPVRSVK